MARPLKTGLDYFPLWKPQISTETKFYSGDLRIRYKSLRNSSSGFIRRADVRKIIMSKFNNTCVYCGSTEDLQIDHIVSVYLCARGLLPICQLNIEENLSVLCRECNARRLPNEPT